MFGDGLSEDDVHDYGILSFRIECSAKDYDVSGDQVYMIYNLIQVFNFRV